MALRSQPLEGRIALVTGANHGIGAATALALARRGADVVITYLRGTNFDESEQNGPHRDTQYRTQRDQTGEAVKAEIEALGQRCSSIEADLADSKVSAALFDHAEVKLGPVSVLVHNASGWKKDSFAEGGIDHVGRAQFPVTETSIDLQLKVDARAGALLMAEFIRRHRIRGADWGRIVTMTSGEGRGFPGEASYGAAKAALISYTLTAASEMAGDGVTANVIYPPVTDTGWITDEVREFVTKDHEHHHVASPQEVADVVAWLCAEAGRVVTGNILRLR